MRVLILSLLVAFAMPLKAQGFGPLSHLVGHCFQADVPVEGEGKADNDKDLTAKDRHCFAIMLGGALVKDTHDYQLEDAPTLRGETVYALENGAGLKLTHYSGVGGIETSRAAIESENTLIYKEDSANNRARLILVDGGYKLVSEKRKGGEWAAQETLFYQRVQ